MGGYDGTFWLDSTESWAPGERAWRPEPALLSRRHGLGAAVARRPGGGEALYAVGGHDPERL